MLSTNIEVLITGGTSGLGAAFAKHYAQLGKRVAIIGRRSETLTQQADTLTKNSSGSVSALICDLSDPAQVNDLCISMSKATNLEVLINNAGYTIDGRFDSIEFENHQKLLNTHIFAVTQLCHSALKTHTNHSNQTKPLTIINIASIAAFIPTPNSPLYGPTKRYILELTDTLRLSYDTRQVRCIVVAPGFIRTDFHEKLGIDPIRFYKRSGLFKAHLPDQVVQQTMRDLQKNRRLSITGYNYRFLYRLLQWIPTSFLYWLLSKNKKARA